ncbi:aromatic amino acid lyase, partial [Staphylococcus hominis]
MTLQLNGEQLTIRDIQHFLANNDSVEITKQALSRVKDSRATVERIIRDKETIYGITTG